MKIKEIIDISPSDLSAMSTKSLRALSAQANKATNRRITALKEAKLTSSFAYQDLPKKVQKAGKYTTPKSLTRAQLVNQLQSQQQFLRARSSTVTGYNKVITEAQRRWAEETRPKDIFGKPKAGTTGKIYKQFRYYLGESGKPELIPEAVAKKRGIKTITSNRLSRVFEMLHKLQEAQPEMVDNLTSHSVRDTIIRLSDDWWRFTDDEGLRYLENIVRGYDEQLRLKQAETEKAILEGGTKSRF